MPDLLIVDLMNAVSDDHEADVLEALLVRSGHRWRCPCGWVNFSDDERCDNCNAVRPTTGCPDVLVDADEPPGLTDTELDIDVHLSVGITVSVDDANREQWRGTLAEYVADAMLGSSIYDNIDGWHVLD